MCPSLCCHLAPRPLPTPGGGTGYRLDARWSRQLLTRVEAFHCASILRESLELSHAPLMAVWPLDTPLASTVWAPLLAPLPDTVHLMSLEPAPTREPLEGGRVLLLRYAAECFVTHGCALRTLTTC